MNKGRLLENYAPIAGGAAAALIFYFWFPNFHLPPTVKDLLAGALNVSCMAVGFLATAKAILISISGKEIIQNLMKLNYYAILVDYFMSAIHWSLLTALFSAILILVDFNQTTAWTHFLFSSFILTSVTAVFQIYRILRIFGKLLRSK